MEIELQLMDPGTLDLTDGILPLLEALQGHPNIKAEFNQATVEINSTAQQNMGDLGQELYGLTALVRERCRELNIAVSGGGTHPFCSRPATITPVPRYVTMERYGGYLSHMLMTYAFQVHVGMASGEEAVAVMRRLRPYLPVFMALSASSPFWWGNDTGYACYRNRVLASMRSYGLPPHFGDWGEFSKFFEGARRARVFDSFEDIHWDMRPRADMGTLELRVMDNPATLREALAVASFIYVLAEFLREEYAAGEHTPLIRPSSYWVEKENHFRASLSGMDAVFIEDEGGGTVHFRKVMEDVLVALAPTAASLGLEGEFGRLAALLDGEPAYERQRRVFRDTGSLREVAASLVRELDEDLERPGGQGLISGASPREREGDISARE
jgi:carboxylate-amine ligase